MQLTEISIYPVKSCAGITVQSTVIDRFGPRGDRRWMVVGADGGFITQRDHPAMCRVRVTPRTDGLHLAFAGSELLVDAPGEEVNSRLVRVWEDHVAARDGGDEAAAWLSTHLGVHCRLVYMPQDAVRMVDGAYASEGETVGFADGFPLLLIAQASLDDLNARLPRPVPMNRFRPNLVVSGLEPFAEDGWRRIRIGAMEFDVAKPCSRCVIPSIVQETGERDPAINRVLAGYRRRDGQIYFGQNLLYQGEGELRVGDEVEVLE